MTEGSSPGRTSWCRELAGAECSAAGRAAAGAAGVRLEREGNVVHCYGHGGAGVTLSWGCADEVRPSSGHPLVEEVALHPRWLRRLR